VKVFLIDNAESMAPHWPRLLKTMRVLLHKVRALDKDGVDLYLTQGGLQPKQRNDHDALIKILIPPPEKGVQTYATSSLNDIFDDYKRKSINTLQHNAKQKQLKLLFLTDGAWCTPTDCQKVSSVIENFVAGLVKVLRTSDDHSVGIEFIRFGEIAQAIEGFRWLDDEVDSIS
jgi:hypothetical protein